MSSLLTLPPDMVHVVLQQLDERSLVRAAGTCRLFGSLSDSVARARCAAERGRWSQGFSWRIQLLGERCGRAFRPCTRVLHQLGSAGTRRRSQGCFNKPVAVTGLSANRIVVCNAGSRCLTIVSLASGALLETLSIDGVPGGLCALDQPDVVAVSVQGTAESGDPLPGVGNPRHRIEAYSVPAAGPAMHMWTHDATELAYPNGMAASAARGELFVADWNHHRVAVVVAAAGWSAHTAHPHEDVLPSEQDWRPCDIAPLPMRACVPSHAAHLPDVPEIGALAVADYYGKEVRIYRHGVYPSLTAPDGPRRVCWVIGGLGTKRRARAAALERPSSLAVEACGEDWARVLVAETGAMCVSVFHAWQACSGGQYQDRYLSRHLCDIGVEQLGSGLHAPLRGEWGWLGVARMPTGDIVVSDCDNNCLMIL